MKRIIVAIVLVFIFFVGIGVHAQKYPDFDISEDFVMVKAQAGITPGSSLYVFKIFAEDVWQDVLGVFSYIHLASPQTEWDYVKNRQTKRQNELKVVWKEYGMESDESSHVSNLLSDHRADHR